MRSKWFLLFFLLVCSVLSALSYEVHFIGVNENYILKTIENSSDLVKLKKRPPSSYSSLRYRASSDIGNIKKALDAYGYYDAQVNFQIKEGRKLTVTVFIDPGTRYILKNFNITFTDGPAPLTLQQLGVQLNQPTSNLALEDFKQKAKKILENEAYPLAKVQKFDIVVDKESKNIIANMIIEKKERCLFGPTIIIGLEKIKPEFVRSKLTYQEGELFSPAKLNETKQKLMKTELFASLIINTIIDHPEDHKLPIKIYITEAKEKVISLGAYFANKDGFGGTFTFATHNFRGAGELLSLSGNIAQKAQTGSITWSKTDFGIPDQNIYVQAYAEKDWPSSYHAYIYGGAIRMEHKIVKPFFYSYGLKNEYIDVFHSGNDGKYYVLGLPAFINYNTSNDLLNPSKGINLRYYIALYKNLWDEKKLFFKQKITLKTYVANNKDARMIFAFRFQFGSIFGPSVYNIPLTKLFLGGTDEDLRGYRYQTVGPRNKKGDMLGGRSCIFFSFEPRIRLTDTIGIVPFLDVGKSNLSQLPVFNGRWRKSLGIGGRYFLVMGPIRVDVGFPLDRYSKGDPRYRFYVSLGQAY